MDGRLWKSRVVIWWVFCSVCYFWYSFIYGIGRGLGGVDDRVISKRVGVQYIIHNVCDVPATEMRFGVVVAVAAAV